MRINVMMMMRRFVKRVLNSPQRRPTWPRFHTMWPRLESTVIDSELNALSLVAPTLGLHHGLYAKIYDNPRHGSVHRNFWRSTCGKWPLGYERFIGINQLYRVKTGLCCDRKKDRQTDKTDSHSCHPSQL